MKMSDQRQQSQQHQQYKPTGTLQDLVEWGEEDLYWTDTRLPTPESHEKFNRIMAKWRKQWREYDEERKANDLQQQQQQRGRRWWCVIQ